MTTYYPVVFPPQFYVTGISDYASHVIKCYEESTTTPIDMATNSTGGTTVDSIALNANGLPEVSGNVVIPHIDRNYKLALYASQAAADANSGAILTIDNIKISSVASSGASVDIASASTLNLNSTDTNYFNITGTTGITSITLAEGAQVWVKFAGALTLTDGSSFLLLGGENITTAAGDIAVLRGEASSVVRMLAFHRADGTVLSGSAANGQALLANGSGGSSWRSLETAVGNAGGYRTDHYYFGFGFTANAADFAVTADQIYLKPFMVSEPETFTRIGLYVTVASAGNARLGIYHAASGLPTDLVIDAGTVSTATTGEKEITISQALTTGAYFLAVVFDATPSVVHSSTDEASLAHLLGSLTYSGSGGQMVGFYDPFPYAVLPDPVGALTEIVNTNTLPHLWLRKV